MDSLLVTVRLATILLVALVLPQAIGYAFYRWVRSKRRYFSALAMLIPASVFYVVANVYWGYQASAIRAGGHYVCGAFGAAAVFSTMFGTLLHLVGASAWLAVLSFVWKRKTARRAS